MLFLFLGLPGAVLAALLTAALVGAGASRRRNEQALLRTRGLAQRRIGQLAVVEALVVGVTGALLGLVAALHRRADRVRSGQSRDQLPPLERGGSQSRSSSAY